VNFRGLVGKLFFVFAGILFLAASVVTLAYFYLQSSRQELEGTIRVSGLRDPVTVVMDSFAIPHLYAVSERDLFYAQGFVHASERLWQMEMFRRVAQGRLAELFGERALGADKLLRTLDLWGAAEQSLGAIGDEAQGIIESYAAGVNARIASWKGPLPPEFIILGIEPEPWELLSTVAIGKVMALDLSAWRTELARFHAHAILPPEKAAYLPPAYPNWGATILRDSVPIPFERTRFEGRGEDIAWRLHEVEGGGLPQAPQDGELEMDPVSDAPSRLEWRRTYEILARLGFHASNAWAVGRDRTAHGGSLLASDMHLGLDAPAKWYIQALHAEETGYHVAGVSLPGAPGVVVGYNRGVAWGFTNGMTDDMDFSIEALNQDGTAYREGDGWLEFMVSPDTIWVRGREAPVVHPLRRTVRGPVITDVLPPLGATLSVLWVGARGSTEIEGLLQMNRATDADEFDAAIQAFDSPQQNVVYAASDGTIGYRLSGTVPMHRDVDGSLPIEFDRIGDWWRSFWPPSSLPAVREPDEGFIATANNLQAPNLFGLLGSDYAAPFRAGRISERLTTGSRWTWEGMAALQHDTHSGLADRVGARAAAAARRAREDSAAVLLEDWDRDVSLDSRAAPLFYAWFYRLRELVAGDEFQGEPWEEFPTMAFLRVLEEGDGPWVDDVRTDTLETLSGLEERAIRDAVAVTRGRPWGELHVERSVHTLGRSALIERIFRFNVGPYPSPGGPNTVRPDDYGRWSPLDSTAWTPPYVGDYGPSERFIAVMGDEGSTGYLLLPTGQSGNPFSVHYRDMSQRWSEPRLIPVPLSKRDAEDRAVRRFQLRPTSR
jgi:penicillin amidase